LGFSNFLFLKRVCAFFLVCVATLVLSGCSGSLLSASGPDYKSLMQATDNDQVDFDIIDLSPDTIGPYLLTPTPIRQQMMQSRMLPSIIMPGDILTIEIAETESSPKLFASLSSGGTSFKDVRVTDQGKIDLPYVGSISAQGLTAARLSQKIKQTILQSVPSAQVRVTITSDLSSSVLISGAIKNPGRYSPLKGPMTLVDVIALAGGATAEPHLINVTVRSPNSVESLTYQDVLYGENRMLGPRSEVILQRNRQSFIAMGAVSTPGLFDMPSSHPSLLQVLGVVGGLQQSTADPSGVFVFRRAGFAEDGKPIALVFRLDMSRPEAIMLASAFQVKPEDALYVTNAGVYQAQKVIAPIVQMIILGNTVTGSN
jgi:polysaccharide export outer membrane protein